MNQNVASYPSVLGVPDCIEERVAFDASLAQVVGSSAQWSSFESRYQSGIVTGSAFLTPELRAWRESHESTFVSLALGRAFRCTLTQWEPRADSQGRAIVSYASLLVETYYLPRPDALVCLYVPRWQSVQGGDVIEDLSGNDYHLTRTAGTLTWNADGSVTVSRTGAVAYQGETVAMNEHTMLADREGFWKNSAGVIYANYNGFKTRRDTVSINVIEITRTNYQFETYSNRRSNNVTSYVDESRTWVSRRRDDYCGHNINYNNETRTPNIIVLGGSFGSSGSCWRYVWCVAMWSVSLTDAQIVAAKRYLSQPTRPS